MAKYMTFEDVLAELQIDEEELKKLVSQGELRGFRDGRSMKFKTDDVLNLKEGRETEPTIILTDSDQEMGIAESSDELILEDSTSDTVINIGDIMGGGKSEQQEIVFDTTEEFTVSPHDSDPEAAIPTVEVPSISEDVGFEDSDAQLVEVGSSDFTSSGFGSDSAIEIASGSSASMETEAFELMEESGETDGFVAEVRTSGRAAPSRRGSSVRMRALAIQQKKSHPAWTAVLLIMIVIPLVVQGGVLYNDVVKVEPEWVMSVSEGLRGVVEKLYVAFNDK
jgi:hypothetical protein